MLTAPTVLDARAGQRESLAGRLLGRFRTLFIRSVSALRPAGTHVRHWLDGLTPFEIDTTDDTSLTQAELEVLK